jgi:hypothetical protein
MAHLKDNKLDLAKVELGVGAVLPLNPKTERFTENEEANKMLTRNYRKGFEMPVVGTA